MPEITFTEFPSVEENDNHHQELLQPLDSTDHPVHPLITWLNRYSAQMEQRIAEERESLEEHRRQHQALVDTLRNERDLARSDLDEQHLWATKNEKELREEVCRSSQLAERLEELEHFLGDERLMNNKLNEELEKVKSQLADAETDCATKQSILDSTLSLLARKENENSNIREQLDELGVINSLLNLERAKNDEQNSEIISLKAQLVAERSQTCSLEEQLEQQSNELRDIRGDLLEERARESELQSELLQARREADLVGTLRCANNELEARCKTLEDEAAELHNDRHADARRINALEEQQRTTSGWADRLNVDLQSERTRTTELQSTISGLRQNLNRLNAQHHALQGQRDELTNANATLQNTRNSMRIRIFILQARSSRLNAEVAELKSVASQRSAVMAKLPRYPALVRARNSPSKPVPPSWDDRQIAFWIAASGSYGAKYLKLLRLRKTPRLWTVLENYLKSLTLNPMLMVKTFTDGIRQRSQ
ncbi:hypothetical protein BDV12DRAFT_199598 [Aspergillus spectabilis]